jgi:hypothetical protein
MADARPGEKEGEALSPYALLSSVAASMRTAEYASAVTVRGVYRRKSARDYGGVWYDELQDEQVPGCRVEVRTPSDLRASVPDGRPAVLSGVLVAECTNGRFRLILNVSGVRGVESPAAERALRERLELIRSKMASGKRDVYGALRSRLAQGEKVQVVLVTGSESVVRRDVEAALGPVSMLYDLVWEQVNMASPVTVASALQAHARSTADVVAVVRGGGAGLEVFNDPQVARAAVSLPCPLVTALGHAVDVSLLDEVADLNLETPTRLGQWLRELAEQVASERAASLAAVQREVDALRRDLEVARRERDRLSVELLEARSRVESLSGAVSRGARWGAAAPVAGALLVYALMR